MKIPAKLNSPVDWSKFSYMVFDVPKHSGTYEERYAMLGTIL
mgnify:FL=1